MLVLAFVYLGERKDPQFEDLLNKYGNDQIFSADILGGLFGRPALQISSRRTVIGDYVRTSRVLLI